MVIMKLDLVNLNFGSIYNYWELKYAKERSYTKYLVNAKENAHSWAFSEIH